MEFNGLGAILLAIFIAWRIHEHVVSKRTRRELDELYKEHDRIMLARRKLSDIYYSCASAQSRGGILPEQQAHLDAITARGSAVTDRQFELMKEL